MKAKAVGMFVQDYLTDHIKEERISQNEKRVIHVKGASPELLNLR